jgi:hypothetical protein
VSWPRPVPQSRHDVITTSYCVIRCENDIIWCPHPKKKKETVQQTNTETQNDLRRNVAHAWRHAWKWPMPTRSMRLNAGRDVK